MYLDNFCCQSSVEDNAKGGAHAVVSFGYTTVNNISDILLSRRISSVESKDKISSSSTLLCLSPFLDVDGVMRVSGRLTRSSDFSFDECHPMVIPVPVIQTDGPNYPSVFFTREESISS